MQEENTMQGQEANWVSEDGQTMIRICSGEIEACLAELLQFVKHPTVGAVSTFLGTTRDFFDSKTVNKLEYDCYTPMAMKEFSKICDTIRSKWEVKNIAIVHRLGEVKVEEISVAIYISSCHRTESLEAVNFAINELKARVPIWKKEHYGEGENMPTWKENSEWSAKDVAEA